MTVPFPHNPPDYDAVWNGSEWVPVLTDKRKDPTRLNGYMIHSKRTCILCQLQEAAEKGKRS